MPVGDGTKKAGDLPFAAMRRKDVLALRDALAETPKAANERVKLLRRMFETALDNEDIEHDPMHKVKLLESSNPDGIHAWTPDEFQQYMDKHPVGTPARLALDLFLYTDQRISDVYQLGRQHGQKNGWLYFTQFKGRNKSPVTLWMPIISILRQSIDATPTGDLTYIISQRGKPYQSAKSFGNRFRKWCDEAELYHCSAHGVRKGAAAWYAEIGLTNQMLKALGGWKTDKEVQRYTESARQKVLAETAVEMIEAHIKRTKVANPEDDGQKVRQKRGANH